MPEAGRHNPIRRGVTLVELMIVVSILVILMAAAIPVMRPAVEGRRIREAARAINVYLGSARNRAMETGRPCGVVIRRFVDPADPTNPAKGLPQCAMLLEQAEVPPPYGGDTLDAGARLQIPASGGSFVTWPDGTVKVVANLSSLSPSLVSLGDLVQFNHQGLLYTIATAGPPLELKADLSQGQLLPWPSPTPLEPDPWSGPVSYEIFRQPMKSAAAPLQLPTGAVIDLEASGTNRNPTWFESTTSGSTLPITIMFSPTGAVDRVYLGPVSYPVTEPIFLLIGKRERIPAGSAEDGLANWQDLTNLWVTLNPQTGLVTTTENAYYELPANFDYDNPDHRKAAFQAVREFARQAQSMGGR